MSSLFHTHALTDTRLADGPVIDRESMLLPPADLRGVVTDAAGDVWKTGRMLLKTTSKVTQIKKTADKFDFL